VNEQMRMRKEVVVFPTVCALNLDLVREGVEEAMPMSVFGDEPSASSSTATDSWLLDMIEAKEPMTLTQELRRGKLANVTKFRPRR